MLYAERNAYYGYAAEDPESDMQHCYFNASEYDPDDVHQDCQTSGVIRSRNYVASERPERKTGHLEELQTERDAYYGQTE